MASYRLVFKQSVAKDLRSIPNEDVARILKRVEILAADPHPAGSEKLSSQDRYRVRQGVYRIIYAVDNEEMIVLVVKISHRRRVYKNR
jgi:mRNA interferase RelE/StbE